MEIKVNSAQGDGTSSGINASRTIWSEYGINPSRTYGICVKINPLKRSLSQPTSMRPVEYKMEKPCFQTEDDLVTEDCNFKNYHITSKDQIVTDTASPSGTQSQDLFDQLVEYFNNKSENNKGTNSKSLRRAASFQPAPRKSARSISRKSHGSSKNFPGERIRVEPIVSRQSSTPDSSTDSYEIRGRDSAFTRLRSPSSSSSEQNSRRLHKLYCRISSDSVETRRSDSRETSDFSNTDDSVSVFSNTSASLLRLDLKSRVEPSTAEMLRSQMRRSMTPDLPGQHRSRTDGPSYINSLLSPSSSRNSLDRVTADSIDRNRMKRAGIDKFNDTIEGVTQLSGSATSLPLRSKSAMGHFSRDMDNRWDENTVNDRKSHTLSGAYTMKDYSDARNAKSPSFASSNSLQGGRNWHKSQSMDSTSKASQSSDSRTTPSLYVADEFVYEIHARPNSALDVALNEDHDSIMRLVNMREDQFTSKLISAMRELKDIAEVARIIDEVDNEEWLLVFIGELDHRLRYLMKLEEEDEEPQDHEANLREKATILDVALDLITFLKDRSGYRAHRRESKQPCPSNESSTSTDDGSATIKRLRKIADAAPQSNPYDMQKWQRQLMNLAGTLDKYITVLQKEKPTPTSKVRNFNSSPKGYQKLVLGSSFGFQPDSAPQESDSSGRSSREPKETSATGVITYQGTDNNGGRSFGVIKGGFNHNNNNNSVPHANVTSQPAKTIPVLDLRDSKANSQILDRISQAAHVQQSQSQQKSPNRAAVKSARPIKAPQIDPIISPTKSKRNSRYDKNRPVSSTSSRRDNDQAYQAKSVGDLKKTFEKGISSDDSSLTYGTRRNQSTAINTASHTHSRSLPARSKSLRVDQKKINNPRIKTPNRRFDNDNNPLSSRSWAAGATRDETEKRRSPSGGDRISPLTANAVVSAYCKFPDKTRKRSSSMTNDLEARREYLRQKSEFTMSVGDDHVDSGGVSMWRSISTDSQKSSKSTTSCSKQANATGARPKIRSSATVQPLHRSKKDSSSSSDTEKPTPRLPRVVTLSMSTQCDFDQGLRQREKSTEEMLKQMKRKADLLKTGLEEVRKERDEKDRKIAVLQARLERTKKNLVVGESEKGAVEEEMDRLNKLLKEKTVESEEEISALKRRLQELEKKLEKENKRYIKMNNTIEDLQNQLLSAQSRLDRMKKGKKDLEQQIDELTTALVQERQNSAHLQQENARLELELESKERDLAASQDSQNRSGEELQQQNQALGEELNRARELANTLSIKKDRMKEQVRELEDKLESADGKVADLESQKKNIIGKNSDLEKDLGAAQQQAGSIAKEKSTLEDKIKDLESKLESTGGIIEKLEKEKRDLEKTNQELVEALSHEQMMSKDLAECYMDQVEYLNKELKLNEEMKQAQQDQYDKEISRLLAESSKPPEESDELSRAKEDAKREKTRADELEKENEQLRQQQQETTVDAKAQDSCDDETTVDAKVQDSCDGVSMEDKSVQADDMSYTRMRAFDWYSSEAHRDALRLSERGRQLELETRRRIRLARDAMRAVNVSIIKERRVVTMPVLPESK